MIYAGIGSRKTPQKVLYQMENLARHFARKQMILRSGHAEGADKFFEAGCDFMHGFKEIYKVNSGTHEQRTSWEAVASEFHPRWDKCSNYAKKLHARNTPIVLGANLMTPVDFVVCWTPGGAVTGGTGQALRIADAYKIPIYNLFDVVNFNILFDWCNT